MWTDLTQEEKFNIMRDYVRRGYHNLDEIMNDYDGKEYEKSLQETPSIFNDNQRSAFEEVMREWYGNTDEDYS